jgi:hypothetical protein
LITVVSSRSATTLVEAERKAAGGCEGLMPVIGGRPSIVANFTGVDISMQPGLFAVLPQVVEIVRYLVNVGRKGVRRSVKERASGRTEIF